MECRGHRRMAIYLEDGFLAQARQLLIVGVVAV